AAVETDAAGHPGHTQAVPVRRHWSDQCQHEGDVRDSRGSEHSVRQLNAFELAGAPPGCHVRPVSAPLATPAGPIAMTSRVASIHLIRGAIMVLMPIDPVRVYSGLPAGGPYSGIFFT